MQHKKHKIILLTVFSFFASLICSQESLKIGGGYAATRQLPNVGYTSQIYDATSGLPTSDAMYILCSRDGYVWICGYSGILRYDGSTFERLPTTFGLTSGRALYEDKSGRIWVGTNDNGVVVLENNKARQYTYRDGLPSSSIRSFAEDLDGNIYIGTTSGICYVDSSGNLFPISDPRIDEERVLKLSADYSGIIYGQSKNGLIFKIDDKKITAVYDSAELGIEKITSIMVDPLGSGNVYFCTQGSALYFGDFGKRKELLKKIDVSPMKDLHWISYDCGKIWLSSSTMLGYLNDDNELIELKNIPMNSSIEMQTADYQGNIWTASATQGVMKLVTNNFVNLTYEAGRPEAVTNTTFLHKGLLYAGTDQGLEIIDEKKHSIKNELTSYIGDARIRCIISDKQDNLWIGTYTNNLGLVCVSKSGKITSYTKKDGMPHNQIRCMVLSDDGSILAGTNGGLAVIKDGKIIKTATAADGIRNTEFLTVAEGKDGSVYAGSDGDGIYVISDSGIRHISRDEGLTSNVIMRIKKDDVHGVYWLVTSNSIEYLKDGEIHNVTSFPYNNNYDLYFNSSDEAWILSSYGIFTLKASDLLSNSVKDYMLYTIANGLPYSITANSYSVQDDSGMLYIGGRHGVIRVNINHYFDHNSSIKVSLNSVYCDDQKILPGADGSYVLPASKGRVRLNPGVLDYSMANPLVRMYLEGSGDAGITAKRNELTSLEYTGLSYGSYTFHIQLLDNDRTNILLDKSFVIIKKPRLTELFFIRIFFMVLAVVAAGFVVWRFMKSTVITRQLEEIRQARDEAERASTAKSRFLSNMSQQILTPINTIMGMNEMIMREDAKGVPKSYFMSIMNYSFDVRSASESLLAFINDLLEMTKIETGKLQLVQQEYDVQEVLRSIIYLVRIKAEEKELKFDVFIDEMIPSRLYGDVGKIKQVILNLLSNAVKYTERGSVELRLTMESRSDDMCGLCFSVKDTGIGIKQEDVESLFDVYKKSEEDENSSRLKAGLGLDISRKFAELMGGVLVCQSTFGEGSEFIFTLMQKITSPEPLGQFSETVSSSARGPYIPQFIAPDADVLIVDDTPVSLKVLAGLLKPTRVFVSVAESCEECLGKIRYSPYNVVLLNHQVPGIDGELAIQKIRDYAPELPVYALTENTSFDEDYFKSLGYNGFLSIPIDSAVLERTIMRHLPQSIMAKPTKNDAFVDYSELPSELLWLNDVEGLSVPDGIKNSGGIGSFVFAIRLFYDTIDEFSSSLNHAYEAGDFKLYMMKARMLKNSAMFVGALALFDFAAKMEEACKSDDRIFISANTEKLLSEYRNFKQKLGRLSEAKPEQDLKG